MVKKGCFLSKIWKKNWSKLLRYVLIIDKFSILQSFHKFNFGKKVIGLKKVLWRSIHLQVACGTSQFKYFWLKFWGLSFYVIYIQKSTIVFDLKKFWKINRTLVLIDLMVRIKIAKKKNRARICSFSLCGRSQQSNLSTLSFCWMDLECKWLRKNSKSI